MEERTHLIFVERSMVFDMTAICEKRLFYRRAEGLCCAKFECLLFISGSSRKRWIASGVGCRSRLSENAVLLTHEFRVLLGLV